MKSIVILNLLTTAVAASNASTSSSELNGKPTNHNVRPQLRGVVRDLKEQKKKREKVSISANKVLGYNDYYDNTGSDAVWKNEEDGDAYSDVQGDDNEHNTKNQDADKSQQRVSNSKSAEPEDGSNKESTREANHEKKKKKKTKDRNNKNKRGGNVAPAVVDAQEAEVASPEEKEKRKANRSEKASKSEGSTIEPETGTAEDEDAVPSAESAQEEPDIAKPLPEGAGGGWDPTPSPSVNPFAGMTTLLPTVAEESVLLYTTLPTVAVEAVDGIVVSTEAPMVQTTTVAPAVTDTEATTTTNTFATATGQEAPSTPTTEVIATTTIMEEITTTTTISTDAPVAAPVTSTVAATTTDAPITAPPLPECPPPYNMARTDYVRGELIEVKENMYQCRIGDGDLVTEDTYEEYCNAATWNDAMMDGNPNAKEMWDDAWVHIGMCEQLILVEILEDEINVLEGSGGGS